MVYSLNNSVYDLDVVTKSSEPKSVSVNTLVDLDRVVSDLKELRSIVDGLSFNDAYEKLKGYNLEVGEDDIDNLFDFNYNSLCGTIMKDGDGVCLGYAFEVWDDKSVEPIFRFTTEFGFMG